LASRVYLRALASRVDQLAPRATCDDSLAPKIPVKDVHAHS